jgi:hypothetical protein
MLLGFSTHRDLETEVHPMEMELSNLHSSILGNLIKGPCRSTVAGRTNVVAVIPLAVVVEVASVTDRYHDALPL